MRGPYRYDLSAASGPERGTALDSGRGYGLLAEAERFAALRAYEWVGSEIASEVEARIYDARETLVRTRLVYTATKGPNRGRIVSERLS